MNLNSKTLNISHIAKLYGMSPRLFLNKLRGYPGNRHKSFTDAERIKIESLIKKDLSI